MTKRCTLPSCQLYKLPDGSEHITKDHLHAEGVGVGGRYGRFLPEALAEKIITLLQDFYNDDWDAGDLEKAHAILEEMTK